MLRRIGRRGWASWFALVLVGAAWLGHASAVRAYTVQTSSAGAEVRWHTNSVALRIDPILEAHFGELSIASLVTDAAAAWQGLHGVPELLVNEGSPAAPGFRASAMSNGVYLIKDWVLRPDALAVTVATFKVKTGKILDADVLINANYRFAWLPEHGATTDTYDLLSVMTHEMGHVLGLGDTYDHPPATMWPQVIPGATFQRDLDADDEAGAERAYANAFLGETVTGAGCGGVSVVRPRPANATHTRGLFRVVVAALAAWACWRAGRRSRSFARGALAFGCVLLFGGPPPPPPPAPGTVAVLGETPMPSERLPHGDPTAKRLFNAFVGDAVRVIEGQAVNVGTRFRAGLLWTRFRVRSDGVVAELESPGGSWMGVAQIVSGHSTPHDGETLVVALRASGPNAWAHLKNGIMYGGSLGDGPALEWQ